MEHDAQFAAALHREYSLRWLGTDPEPPEAAIPWMDRCSMGSSDPTPDMQVEDAAERKKQRNRARIEAPAEVPGASPQPPSPNSNPTRRSRSTGHGS